LSDKNIIEGKVVGGVGMSASATIPNPVVTADHPAAVTANHMLAQATLVDNTSGTKNVLALPLTASVLMPTLGGKTIAAAPATASGVMVFIYPLTETDYTVTLYLNHTDPILYIRKEVIK
jgi:K+-sensing histidine kinase KdpD